MKKQAFFLLKLFISACILYLIFTKISFGEVIQALQASNLKLVLFAFPLVYLSAVLAAIQFKVFSDHYKMNLSFNRIMEVNFATFFYGLFLPGQLSGGAIRWYRFSKDNKKPMQVFTAIVLNRFINLALLVFTGTLGWFLDGNTAKDVVPSWFFLMLSAGTLLIIFCLKTPFLLDFGEKFVDRFVKQGVIREKLLKLAQVSREYHLLSFREHALTYFYALLWHFVLCWSAYLFSEALGLGMSFWSLMWIRSFITFATLLPISIAGLGVREGTSIFFLGLFGVSTASAVAFSALIFSRQLFMGMIGGLVEAKTVFLKKEKAV